MGVGEPEEGERTHLRLVRAAKNAHRRPADRSTPKVYTPAATGFASRLRRSLSAARPSA